eukprot:187195-Pyramimonas_sp.AAC.1
MSVRAAVVSPLGKSVSLSLSLSRSHSAAAAVVLLSGVALPETHQAPWPSANPATVPGWWVRCLARPLVFGSLQNIL